MCESRVSDVLFASTKDVHDRLSREAEIAGFTLIGYSTNGAVSHRNYRCNVCGHKQDLHKDSVKKNEVRCHNCFEQRVTDEARAVGLELIGSSDKGDGYRRYKIVGCGHERDLRLFHVRNNRFSCTECFETTIREEADRAGLEFLNEKCEKTGLWLYKFKSCGHLKAFPLNKVRDENVNCTSCFKDKIVKEADDAGLTLLSKGTLGKEYYNYRFKSCGHEAQFRLGNVRRGVVECKTCLDQKHHALASSRNLVLLGKGLKKNYRLFELPCGHVQEFTLGNVLKGEFRCSECGEHAWVKPAKTYAYKITSGEVSWVKVGYAKDPEDRSKNYGLPEGSGKELLYTAEHPTGRDASYHESEILRSLSDYKIPAEEMKKYHKHSGYTECFTTGCIHLLADLFDKKDNYAF